MERRTNKLVGSSNPQNLKNTNGDEGYLDSLELRPITTSSTTVVNGQRNPDYVEGESSSMDSYDTVDAGQGWGSPRKNFGSHDRSLGLTNSGTSTTNSNNTDLDALDVESTDSDTTKSFRPLDEYDRAGFLDGYGEARKNSYDSSHSNIWRPLSPISSPEFHPARSQGSRNRIHSKQDSEYGNFNVVEHVEGDSLITSGSTDSESSSATSYGANDASNDTENAALVKNAKPKIGDSIPSVSQKVDNQDKLYNSLNILEDVKKLKNMSFFDAKYNEKLNQLKKNQLDLLVDMSQLNENSFTEFYNVWNTLDEEDEKSEGSEEKKGDKKKNDKYEQSVKSLAMLDINNSKTFERFGEKSKVVTQDISKIEESITGIDEYTKKLWEKV